MGLLLATGALNKKEPGKPANRNVFNEGAETLTALNRLLPMEYGMEQRWLPQYNALASQSIQDLLLGTEGGTREGEMTSLQWQAPVYGYKDQNKTRWNYDPSTFVDPTGLSSLFGGGGKKRKKVQLQPGQWSPVTKKYSYEAPKVRGIVDVMNEAGDRALQGYKESNPEMTALLGELNTQAQSELGLGAQLDPSLRREVQQSVRSGQSARGLGYGPSDVYEEAMTTGSAGQAMQDRRRSFAELMTNLNQQVAQAAFARNVLGQQNVGPAFAAGQERTNVNPLNPYAADVYNTNFNAKWADVIGTRNYNAATQAALIGAIGSIVGGAGGAAGGLACWVAREVFGWENPKWITFRCWLLGQRTLGGRALRHIYMRWGERFAGWIHDKPRVRGWVRRWMESKIRSPKSEVRREEG